MVYTAKWQFVYGKIGDDYPLIIQVSTICFWLVGVPVFQTMASPYAAVTNQRKDLVSYQSPENLM